MARIYIYITKQSKKCLYFRSFFFYLFFIKGKEYIFKLKIKWKLIYLPSVSLICQHYTFVSHLKLVPWFRACLMTYFLSLNIFLPEASFGKYFSFCAGVPSSRMPYNRTGVKCVFCIVCRYNMDYRKLALNFHKRNIKIKYETKHIKQKLLTD